MYEFFVSYSRYDADFARAIWESLNLLGVPAWMAEAEILIEGRKTLKDRTILRDVLAEATAASRRCLLLMSPRALASEWVMQVEVPPFLEQERDRSVPVVWPVLVGPDMLSVRDRWPAALAGRTIVECRNLTDVEPVVREVCRAAGVTIQVAIDQPQSSSSRTVVTRLTVATEHRRFVFALDIGTEWIVKPPVGRGMLLNLVNHETDLMLNLIVGAMPRDLQRNANTEHIEEANYFAESFVTRRINFLSQLGRALTATQVSGRQKVAGLLELLKLKLTTAATGRQEILGSHIFNVQDQPHFAYTYRMKPPYGQALIARKYSIILAPPGARSDRYFEFVFTAGFAGEHVDFLRRSTRVDSIVRSFRFVD